jgi:hypothetical protein
MGNFAQTGLQASDAFSITKSDSADLSADANNPKGYKFAYVSVVGTSGNVQVTPVDGRASYTIATALSVAAGGTGYTSGTYNGVTLTYLSGKVPSTNVVANITVASGVVTGATYVSGGSDADTSTVWQYSGGQNGPLGGGSGFQASTATVNSSASDVVVLYGVQGTVLGGTLPIAVRRVWATNTAAGNLVALVTKGGLGA